MRWFIFVSVQNVQGALPLIFFTRVFNEKCSQSDTASQASGSSVFLSSQGTDVVLVSNNRVLFLKARKDVVSSGVKINFSLRGRR